MTKPPALLQPLPGKAKQNVPRCERADTITSGTFQREAKKMDFIFDEKLIFCLAETLCSHLLSERGNTFFSWDTDVGVGLNIIDKSQI